MSNNLRSMIGYCGMAAVVLVALSRGEVLAAEDKILAHVDGRAVHQWELNLAEDEIGEDLAQVAQGLRKAILLRYVIDTRLMAMAGSKAGLEKDQAFQRRLDYAKTRALRDTYFEKNIREAITDVQLRPIYEREIKKNKPTEEVKARHILVKKHEDALDLVERLNRGDDFVTLAKEKSEGPSGRNGGDLGYFPKGRMVKSFEETAFALKPGEISAPVKSSFGWHIIKVEDRRMTPVPSFDDLKGRISAQLVQQKSRAVTKVLRESAKVEIVDKALAKKMQAIQ